MKNFSVLILYGEEEYSLNVARCLGQIQGLKLHVLSRDKWIPLRFSRYHSTFQVVSYGNDNEQRLINITEALKQTRSDIILPVTEPTVRFVSTQRASLLELANITPVPIVDVFDMMVNKWLLAGFLEKHHIPCPGTILYTGDEKFKKSLNKLSFPVLLKPIRGSGGRGIEFFNDLDSLLQALDKNEGFVNQKIIQNFIDGDDIDCSVLCQDGKILAYTIQKGIISSNRRFAPPAGIEFVKNEQTFSVVSKWASTTRWSGVAHLDLRYDNQDGQTKIIEVNARYWGSVLGSLVAGVNFPYLACLAGLGIPFAKPDYDLKRFIFANSVAKSKIKIFFGKNVSNFPLGESSGRFAATDPLATIFNLGRGYLQS